MNIHGLRITDPETARVVAVHHCHDNRIVGSGCLIDAKHVITCLHVIKAALSHTPKGEERVIISLPGLHQQPSVFAYVISVEAKTGPENDLALMEIRTSKPLAVPPVEFASPLRHSGKRYSVFGFPGGDRQGRNVVGYLHAADTKGLVQMDRGGALSVLGGFSGAPVWRSDVGAFVGILVREQSSSGVSWCIPSRRLSELCNDLPVKFRMPRSDRPEIHDYGADEPNINLFGNISNNGSRQITATVRNNNDPDWDEEFKATITYSCITGNPRGVYVTFITHPSYTNEDEDGYELFAKIDPATRTATVDIFPEEPFVVAAVGDAGDTALTIDLATLPKKPPRFR